MQPIPVYNGGMDAVITSAATAGRTKRRGRHPHKALSAAFVRTAPPGRHADGNGLYLFVQPTGTRSWVQRIVIRGRRRELGLGAAGLVSLAEARELALANRKLARSGGDPLSEKRRAEGVPTFAEAAERVLEQKRGGWRGRWHAQNWWRSMELRHGKSHKVLITIPLRIPQVHVPLVAPIVLKRIPANQGHLPRASLDSGLPSLPVAWTAHAAGHPAV